MTVKCPKCHFENPIDTHFCGKCATPLDPSKDISVTKTLKPTPKLKEDRIVAGKYRITEKLGEGGMGIVYKAEDAKLNRSVALKFLSPELTKNEEARGRFIKEAQAASALDHPNICTVHEINETEDDQVFIAMACYEGESLKEKISKGPLEPEEVFHIALQVAQGLAKAHKRGIVHRDVKPANVMITTDGIAKILDFGLAKLSGQVRLTQTGATMGTVAYMSPEQAQGEEIDQRTDIWSLGVIIYEMLTGKLPFKGEHEQSVMYSILNETPAPLRKLRKDIPEDLEKVIQKALAKNPEARYGRMDDLVNDLISVSKGFEPRMIALRPLRAKLRKVKKVYLYSGLTVILMLLIVSGVLLFIGRAEIIDSIAVLPLRNASGDPGQDYLSDGMHEALIMELSRIRAIKVISRTSVMGFRGTKKKIREVARELGVAAIVEGSTIRSGNIVRVNVQLIDGRSDEHLWADSFDREYRDILALQSEAALAIAREIQASLTTEETESLTRKRPVNPEAHELYLKGLYHYRKWTKEGWEKAIEYFQDAIKVDPTHAQALATLADSYGCLAFYGYLPLGEATNERINSLLMRALEIDETLAEAHRVLANYKFYIERNWMSAEREYLRAIELNPSYSAAHFSYTWYLISQRRFEKAIAEAKLGQELDPLSIPAKTTVGEVYYNARRYDQAIAQFQLVAEMEPNYPRAYELLARAYEQIGRYEEAVRARQKEMTLAGELPEEVGALARAYDQQGPNGYWMWRLQKLGSRSAPYTAYTAAEIHAHLGNKEEAIALLERAYQDGDYPMVYLKVQAEWDKLRDDPRYQKLLWLMKYPEN